eukprot:3933783-Rhodomonas_salina.1
MTTGERKAAPRKREAWDSNDMKAARKLTRNAYDRGVREQKFRRGSGGRVEGQEREGREGRGRTRHSGVQPITGGGHAVGCRA